MAENYDEYINKMYDSNLSSQKESLKQNYDQSVSDLDAQQQKAQKQTDANLTRTYVEAEKSAKNYGEVQNAYGLTSGAMAQAKLAQDNQLKSNMTAIRTAQQEADAEAERQRNLLAKEYMSAISKAQADNDLARAQALYEAAKVADDRLWQQQMTADDRTWQQQMTADDRNWQQQNEANDRLLQQQKEAASLMASVGDYSLYAALYGLTPEQVAKLQAANGSSGSSGVYYNPTPAEEEKPKTPVVTAPLAELYGSYTPKVQPVVRKNEYLALN